MKSNHHSRRGGSPGVTVRRWGSPRAGLKAAYNDGLRSFSIHKKLCFFQKPTFCILPLQISRWSFCFFRAHRVPRCTGHRKSKQIPCSWACRLFQVIQPLLTHFSKCALGTLVGFQLGVGGSEMEGRDPGPRGIFSLVGQKDKSTHDCAATEGGTRCPKAQKRSSASLVLPGRSRVTELLFVPPTPPVTTHARMGRTVPTDKGSSTSPLIQLRPCQHPTRPCKCPLKGSQCENTKTFTFWKPNS